MSRFPNDKFTYDIDYEFLWGQALLIAPVVYQVRYFHVLTEYLSSIPELLQIATLLSDVLTQNRIILGIFNMTHLITVVSILYLKLIIV